MKVQLTNLIYVLCLYDEFYIPLFFLPVFLVF